MQVHTVQKGDTLWKIAKMYGVDFEELKAANLQLTNPDLIMPGMKILIPGAADERPFHVVKAGDTMWMIAWMHRISVDQLIAENPQIPDPNRITVGMKVYLPTSSLIHGDIAHHNFIMGARVIRIIDLDLASYADPDEEWILLLQRFYRLRIMICSSSSMSILIFSEFWKSSPRDSGTRMNCFVSGSLFFKNHILKNKNVCWHLAQKR